MDKSLRYDRANSAKAPPCAVDGTGRHASMNPTPLTSPEELGPRIPGTFIVGSGGTGWADVLVEIYRRPRSEEGVVVPAVAEPMLVWVLSGAALVEEREFGGPWTGRVVSAGEFFLTTTPTPYELRWQATGPDPFEEMKAYVGLPVFARAAKEVLGRDGVPALREVFGERDAVLSALLGLLRTEVLAPRPARRLFLEGLAQSLAVHLVRTYPAASTANDACIRRGGLPAFKLRRTIDYLEMHLSREIPLAELAAQAGFSEFHFSRLFRRTTGFSPSQYQIRLRVGRARRLLRETPKSVIEIGLEVGYTNPSHFTQIFRREIGVTPTEYRGQR